MDEVKTESASAAEAEIERLNAELMKKEQARAEWETRYTNLAVANNAVSQFHLKMDWLALSNELEIVNGAPVGETGSKVLTFLNSLRMNALAELETKTIEEIVVMTGAYEVWYRACVATLQNRSLRIKIEKNQEFETTKKRLKDTENENKRLKAEQTEASRRRTPEEIMIDQLTKLLGSEEKARAQYKIMQGLAQGVKK